MANTMSIALLLVAALAVASARPQQRPQKPGKQELHSHDGHLCRTRDLSLEEKHAATKRIEKAVGDRSRRDLWDNLRVPVVFHVVHDGSTGRLGQQAIEDQIDVMNAAFSGSTDAEGTDTKITFYLKEAPRYVNNAQWFQNCDANDATIKNSLTDSPDKQLNIITCSGSGYLGWATFPQDYAETNKAHAVVLAWNSLPNQGLQSYDLGDTAVHEVGHFFGLYHTFSQTGQCGDADEVADTPEESEPSYGCPTTKSSCGSPDPYWNFMDYSDDSCMSRFTPGQVLRMRESILAYKPKLVAASTVSGHTTASTSTTKATTQVSTTKPPTTQASTTKPPTTKPTTPDTDAPTTTEAPTTSQSSVSSSSSQYDTTTTTTTSSSSSDAFQLSERTCSQLAWRSNWHGICAASKINRQCHGLKTWDQAKDICHAAGARLCHTYEIEDGLPTKRGDRCGYHTSARLWTADSCGGATAHAAVGIKWWRNGLDMTCSSGHARVVCCGDV